MHAAPEILVRELRRRPLLLLLSLLLLLEHRYRCGGAHDHGFLL